MSTNNVDDMNEILEEAFVHCMECHGNLAYGKEKRDQAKAKLNTLIEQKVVEARIDELVHLVDSGSDTTWKAKEWFSVSERLKQLQAQQDKEQND